MKQSFRAALFIAAALLMLFGATGYSLVVVPDLHGDLVEIGVRRSVLGGTLLHLYFAAIAMFGFATMVTVAAIQSIRGIVPARIPDRKSTRLNSSHVEISYAVFCLKKKKKKIKSAIKYKRAN